MKVRDLIEALEAEDPELRVVVPWSIPKTARECVGVKEADMGTTLLGDYIPHSDPRPTSGQSRVLALMPELRGPDEPKPEEKDEPEK